MDYEPHSATISYAHADEIVAYVTEHGYAVNWMLETHVHADHLTASHYLKEKLEARLPSASASSMSKKYLGMCLAKELISSAMEVSSMCSGEDNNTFMIGSIPALVLHVPGRATADLAYVIGDAVFVGDTILVPDYGTTH